VPPSPLPPPELTEVAPGAPLPLAAIWPDMVTFHEGPIGCLA
jgi:hypothetical protein